MERTDEREHSDAWHASYRLGYEQTGSHIAAMQQANQMHPDEARFDPRAPMAHLCPACGCPLRRCECEE